MNKLKCSSSFPLGIHVNVQTYPSFQTLREFNWDLMICRHNLKFLWKKFFKRARGAGPFRVRSLFLFKNMAMPMVKKKKFKVNFFAFNLSKKNRIGFKHYKFYFYWSHFFNLKKDVTGLSNFVSNCGNVYFKFTQAHTGAPIQIKY